MVVIEIDSLKKSYGKHVGVRDVTFSVNEGEMFGFVGPNGAGKSTTIKTLMGFIFSDSGHASICGLDCARESRRIKAFTGYVPSDVRLYPSMRTGELLRRNAAFYSGDFSAETERLCTLFGVNTGKRFSELSTGNKKKVSVICALMAEPKVVILDEPTNGLDPLMQKNLFEELLRRTKNGCAVLLSSHNLSEVQEYCDRAAFINSGSIISVIDLKKDIVQTKIITLSGGKKEIPASFELLSENGGKRVFRTEQNGGALTSALAAIAPDDFTVENESIEERFWSLYGKESGK